jgi:hypothetical protein
VSTREKYVLLGMACGVAVMLQPWWEGGLRVGFFATALFTVLHIVVAHLPEKRA